MNININIVVITCFRSDITSTYKFDVILHLRNMMTDTYKTLQNTELKNLESSIAFTCTCI